MKKIFGSVIVSLLVVACYAQEETTDSSKTLEEVTIRSFGLNTKPLRSPIPVTRIDANTGQYFNKISLVNGLNTVAGVRMEERSPGSYRINIRGSSLRSPFGVRNIKVYWNDIPVTDPGGNVYFNQFAWNNFSSIEIFKGPAGSMYGAGTGGLILLNNFEQWERGVLAELVGGSYNLRNIFTSARFGTAENKHQVTYSHNETDGYRIQTNMRRDNFTWASRLKSSDRYTLTASVLFTDMYYQTPGALNLMEYNNAPRAARPAAGGFPSAVNAKAAIFQKNMLAGITNEVRLTDRFHNATTMYGSFAQVKNAAIRNYERRNEPSYGGRTAFTYKKILPAAEWQWVTGGEFQQGYFNTQVSQNKNGNPDTLQTNDDINNLTYNIFSQASLAMQEKWFVTAGISLTKTKFDFTRRNQYPVITQGRTYRNELAPRIAVMRVFSNQIYWSASVAKGFSPPTLSEVLPSTGTISTGLEAEQGWNYETNLRVYLFNNNLQLELTGFYYKLNNALVQRRDLSGADFFINAGDIRQKGVELHAGFSRDTKGDLIERFRISSDMALNHFRYGNFIKGTDDFSGKHVPSVPSTTLSTFGELQSRPGFFLSMTYYFASKIFLNDANSAAANAYHLLGCQLGWKKTIRAYRLNIFAGADNLLNEKYSLGNDINAAAGRFYNAAAPRNYYAGVSFQWRSAANK